MSVVGLFSGYLKDTIYSDKEIIEYLKDFLQKPNAELKVLLQTPEEDLEIKNRSFYSICKQSGNCEVKFIPENSEYRDMKAHFITMDDKAYRFCADRDKLNGVASFNRPETVQNLNALFDNLFEQAELLEPAD